MVDWDGHPLQDNIFHPMPTSAYEPVGGCPWGDFLVPNAVVVYTSKKSGWDYWFPPPVVNSLRGMAEIAGENYQAKGYKVIYKLGQSSEELFIDLWKTDGIFAYAFGGHGAEEDGRAYGFVAAPGSESAVSPDQVSPPYHLQAVGAYSCYSADPIVSTANPNATVRWIDLISHDGTFVGFHGAVNWANVWWSVVARNPGVIPP
jgi:hypothetical protein